MNFELRKYVICGNVGLPHEALKVFFFSIDVGFRGELKFKILWDLLLAFCTDRLFLQ